MPGKKLSFGMAAVLAIFALTLVATSTCASAQQERILHGFNYSGVGGQIPENGVIFDGSGNLYGTTTYGGSGVCMQKTVGCGTVFELKPNGRGGWTQTVLHNFGNGGGFFPHSGLVFDKAGNLYGTTIEGGAYLYFGTVFELVHGASGGWTEKILHTFNKNGTDGYYPEGGVTFDAAGNLYGTTIAGGNGSANCSYPSCGTVFELSPGAGGTWTETILHNFSGTTTDGGMPYGVTPALDAAGNLYGTTAGGGGFGGGTVFELSAGAGGWTETVLYSFSASDGNLPEAGVTLDASGNVYGTTLYGGAYGFGTAFELTPSAGGGWTETILHSFQSGQATDGAEPYSNLLLDAAGNVYGTAGGGANSLGVVFELSPTANGWTEKLLRSFSDNGVDGFTPGTTLIFDARGNLYGTTYYGGPHGDGYGGGVVFEITP